MRVRHVLSPRATVAVAAILMLLGLTVAATTRSSGVEAVAPLRIAAVGANDGNRAADDIPLDIPGATVTRLSDTQFNALTPRALRNSYDVIIVTWDSDPDLDVSWFSRLLPYLRLGGGVIYEDPNNTDDIAGIVTVADEHDGSGDVRVIRQVRGLTDGVLDDALDNNHMQFESWARWLKPFLENRGGIVGLYGAAEGGCIVLTGPDNDYHADRDGDSVERNQYRLLLNEVRWVSSCDGQETSGPHPRPEESNEDIRMRPRFNRP